MIKIEYNYENFVLMLEIVFICRIFCREGYFLTDLKKNEEVPNTTESFLCVCYAIYLPFVNRFRKLLIITTQQSRNNIFIALIILLKVFLTMFTQPGNPTRCPLPTPW